MHSTGPKPKRVRDYGCRPAIALGQWKFLSATPFDVALRNPCLLRAKNKNLKWELLHLLFVCRKPKQSQKTHTSVLETKHGPEDILRQVKNYKHGPGDIFIVSP